MLILATWVRIVFNQNQVENTARIRLCYLSVRKLVKCIEVAIISRAKFLIDFKIKVSILLQRFTRKQNSLPYVSLFESKIAFGWRFYVL